MWVDKAGRRRVPYKKGDAGIMTPAWELPVTKSTYVLDESDEEVQRLESLAKEWKKTHHAALADGQPGTHHRRHKP